MPSWINWSVCMECNNPVHLPALVHVRLPLPRRPGRTVLGCELVPDNHVHASRWPLHPEHVRASLVPDLQDVLDEFRHHRGVGGIRAVDEVCVEEGDQVICDLQPAPRSSKVGPT